MGGNSVKTVINWVNDFNAKKWLHLIEPGMCCTLQARRNRPRSNWILQNTLEFLRFVVLHMVQKSLHTADFGFAHWQDVEDNLWFIHGLHNAHLENHVPNAMNLSMEKLGLFLLVISDALKFLHASKLLSQHLSTTKIWVILPQRSESYCHSMTRIFKSHTMFAQSLTKVYTNEEKKLTQSLLNIFSMLAQTVYTPCKRRVNDE